MAMPVSCPKQPLPRDLDVQIVISRPLTELATDMTLMCFLTPEAASVFTPGNGRVRYYSSINAVEQDFEVGSSTWYAANAFFSRQIHPLTMAVGAIYDGFVNATLKVGTIDYEALGFINNGVFTINIDGSPVTVGPLDFTGVTELYQIIALLDSEPSFNVLGINDELFIASPTAGAGSTISYASGVVDTNDVSGLLGLTQATGAIIWQGYTPGGLVSEAALVQMASRCNSKPIYGWCLDTQYRDTQEQKDFADWIESKTPAYFSACTNLPTAYDTGDTDNIGYYAKNKGLRNTSTIYHDNPQVYPDVSYIAYALATNYSLPDSAITMKFKQLEGIEPSPVNETMLTALNSRNINCYVAVGNTSRTVREGVQGADTWYTDTLVNLDNFREELQVEVYNVFLRNKKIPYTPAGQDKLVSAAAKICRKYTRNGVFAERDVEDDSVESGFTTLPATNIIPVAVAMATASERASRVAPPIAIVAYEAGAFHKVTINVDVFN